MKKLFPGGWRICLVLVVITHATASLAFSASFSTGGVRLKKNVQPLRDLKRKNVVSQSLDFSCGAAGLSTLLKYYLNDQVTEVDIINSLLNSVPLEKVRQRRGFSLLDLKSYAQEKGYKVTGYKMDITFLENLKRPVLVPIKFRNYRHFVIVKAVIADRVFIADPAAGNVSMKINKFQKIWTDGIGLVVEHQKPEDQADYALKVKEDDFLLADYSLMRKMIIPNLIRTAIFPGEF